MVPRGERAVRAEDGGPIDVARSLAPLRRGPGDGTAALDTDGAFWRAFWTPLGATTVRIVQEGEGARVEAFGEGAAWALEFAPDLVGARDRLDGFEPSGLVREIHRRSRGLRVVRQRTVLQCLVPAILEQKVTFREAQRSYAGLVRAWGRPAPGPRPLRLPPTAAELAERPYFDFHPLGVEKKRADAIRLAASRARRVEEAADLPPAEARRRLCALPGVGPWTYAEVARRALGDADAVSVGDYHLPNTVAWNLAGEARGDDARMLELLEPYAGHRGRVQRLLELGGEAAPRFGPRLTPRDIRRL